ncbi:MAG: serine/threonine protein kinase [Lysobacterales bacterium]|nr:MAG: serine/threonine protein kinase [Xanthomonadales bacterium]
MTTENLKVDALGTTRLVNTREGTFVERDTRTAHGALRWLARRLAAREAAALAALAGEASVPRLVAFDGEVVRRTYLPGVPLSEAAPRSRTYFVDALRVLRRLHRAGIAHNDLAKEANWLVTAGDACAVVDFQLATRSAARTARFRRRAYEDLRHLLKHKRTYQPQRLTARQRGVLARPTWPTRLWRVLVKPPYLFVTRIVLGWPERAGPAERSS